MSNVEHALARFIDAQKDSYSGALRELQSGRKTSHWIWYVFPQATGLGQSAMSRRYAIQSMDEARAYLAEPFLGARLSECAGALLAHSQLSARDIMGQLDDVKLQSCMTLFSAVPDADPVFARVLDVFFAGRRDTRTLDWIRRHAASGS